MRSCTRFLLPSACALIASLTGCDRADSDRADADLTTQRADHWEVEVPSPQTDPGPIIRFRYTEMAGVNPAIIFEVERNDCS